MGTSGAASANTIGQQRVYSYLAMVRGIVSRPDRNMDEVKRSYLFFSRDLRATFPKFISFVCKSTIYRWTKNRTYSIFDEATVFDTSSALSVLQNLHNVDLLVSRIFKTTNLRIITCFYKQISRVSYVIANYFLYRKT